jgi:hypothetical protein
LYPAQVRPVCREKEKILSAQAQVLRELYDTAPAIATHRTFAPVAIEIDHFKIVALHLLQVYQPVSAYAKAAVAEPADHVGILAWQGPVTVIHHDKIIARTLVFIEMEIHRSVPEMALQII